MIVTRFRHGALAIALVGAVALGGCSSDRPLPELPAPSSAVTYVGSGDMLTAVQLAFTDLHSRLREHYDPPWDISRYALPTGVTWQAVVDHYAKALGGDWHPDERYAEDAGPGYRSQVWTDGERAMAIGAVTRAGEQVLLVLVPSPQ